MKLVTNGKCPMCNSFIMLSDTIRIENDSIIAKHCGKEIRLIDLRMSAKNIILVGKIAETLKSIENITKKVKISNGKTKIQNNSY